jgi:hypothetical protein
MNEQINHEEAEQLAQMKRSESNLARCYLDMKLQNSEMRIALEIALPSMAHTYSGHEDPSVWVEGCGKCRVARLLTNPIKRNGACQNCGSTVGTFFSVDKNAMVCGRCE